MPYGSHGLPQRKRAPNEPKAIQWLWPSTMPRTAPYEVAPFFGVPVAFSGASGNSAQPVAAANVTVATVFSVDRGASVNAVPSGATTKSAAGLGSSAGARPFSPAVRYCLSLV